MKLQDLNRFIAIVQTVVEDGGTIMFMDNNFVEGSNLPITESDHYGNTYQTRELENGTTHRVLKNFPSQDFIREILADRAGNVEFIKLQYYWFLKYTQR
jgi:demethylmenaquinone methyltransferase/2-methoxy-6-polyprenyl-1,4-benzoquinol methylase